MAMRRCCRAHSQPPNPRGPNSLCPSLATQWGVVASILGASVALAVLEQTFRSAGRGQAEKPSKPGALPEPDKDFKRSPGGSENCAGSEAAGCRAAGSCLYARQCVPGHHAASLSGRLGWSSSQTASSRPRCGSQAPRARRSSGPSGGWRATLYKHRRCPHAPVVWQAHGSGRPSARCARCACLQVHEVEQRKSGCGHPVSSCACCVTSAACNPAPLSPSLCVVAQPCHCI